MCVCEDTYLLVTCSAVPCLAAMIFVIVYHFLSIFMFFFIYSPSLSFLLLPFFLSFFLSLSFSFFLYLSIAGVARCCPNAPPTSVTSWLALSKSDQLLVKGVNETLVAQRVVPALITLSSDPEM